MKRKIIWPERDEDDKEIKEGTINGVPFSKVYEQCEIEAEEYMKKKYPKGVNEE